MKIAYITAGAGGMFCGSCMTDNALTGALRDMGEDIMLIPTYTPIRVEQEDYSIDQVFFGGVSVYLQQKVPLFRHLPRWLDRVLDHPRFIRRVASGNLSVNAKDLGELTVSMLKGREGNQRKQVDQLCAFLEEAQPQVVNFTNLLIAGCVPELRRRMEVPVIVTLQGDDIFINDLREPYRSRVLELLRGLVDQVDGFIVHSRYYAGFMQELLDIPAERFHVVPLGLEIRPYRDLDPNPDPQRFCIGYLARLAPEKGLHLLVDAFIDLAGRPGAEKAQLCLAGWLGEQHRGYAEEQFARLRAAGLGNRFTYAGEVDHAAKLEFLRGLDLFSVPTAYHEPKGLFVLEAMAAGLPVLQPDHGAFPEIVDADTGILFPPGNARELADQLERLMRDDARRIAMGRAGREKILSSRSTEHMAAAWLKVYERFQGEPG